MSHEIECFSAAVAVLAGHGHIKQRLVKAFDDNLSELSEDSLPIPLKQPFADLKLAMSRVKPLNGEGAALASVRKMSVDEADRCAMLMVDLYGRSLRCADVGQAALPLGERPQDPVPPFLVKSG